MEISSGYSAVGCCLSKKSSKNFKHKSYYMRLYQKTVEKEKKPRADFMLHLKKI
jgi:hypothetical protein